MKARVRHLVQKFWKRTNRRKPSEPGRRMTAWAAALFLCVGALGAGGVWPGGIVWAASNPSIELEAGGTDLYQLTLRVKNAQFNSLQLQLKYDTTKLTPASDEGEAAESLYDMLTTIAPMYSAAQEKGWMSFTGLSLDKAEGILDLTLYANADSRGVPDGSDEEGFITADGEGEDLLTLSFQKLKGAELDETSLILSGDRGNPTGILLVCKNETMSNNLEGLTNGAMVSIAGHVQPDTGDEHNFGTPKDETEGNENEPGGSGGTAGPGSGGTGGTDSGSTGTGSAGNGNGGTAGGQTGGFGETGGTGAQKPAGAGNGSAAALTDLSGHWAQNSIQKLVEQGIVGGYPDGTFRPEAGLSRGEFAQILYRALKLPLPEHISLPFSDTRDHWAQTAVAAVYYGGYASGTTSDSFGVEESITREQLVTILCRAKGIEPAAGSGFTDDSQISDWAKGYVYAAKAAGILSGYEDGSFGPQRGMTRGEMAYVTAQILE